MRRPGAGSTEALGAGRGEGEDATPPAGETAPGPFPMQPIQQGVLPPLSPLAQPSCPSLAPSEEGVSAVIDDERALLLVARDTTLQPPARDKHSVALPVVGPEGGGEESALGGEGGGGREREGPSAHAPTHLGAALDDNA